MQTLELEQMFSEHFEEKCKLDNISIEYPELKDIKYKRNYDRLVYEILHSNPIEDNESYEKMDEADIINEALNIVHYLLGDAVSRDELIEAAKIIYPNDSKEVMDGTCCNATLLDEKTEKLETKDIIFIPKLSNTASIVCTVHELLHYFERADRIRTYDNYRLVETMSQLGEAIASYLLEQQGIEKNLVKRIRTIRISCMKVQQQGLLMYKANPLFARMLKTEPELKDAYNYEFGRNYSTLVGFVNQVNLMNRYFEDYKTFLAKLNSLYKGEIKTQDILDYYGIDIRKSRVVEPAISLIKEYK